MTTVAQLDWVKWEVLRPYHVLLVMSSVPYFKIQSDKFLVRTRISWP